jgi:hypothetical protein
MHAKLQWLQDKSQVNAGNPNNSRRITGRQFRDKQRGYLKDKVNEPEMRSKNKNCLPVM